MNIQIGLFAEDRNDQYKIKPEVLFDFQVLDIQHTGKDV